MIVSQMKREKEGGKREEDIHPYTYAHIYIHVYTHMDAHTK